MTTVFIFKEYSGLPIPSIFPISRGLQNMPETEHMDIHMDIYRKNVKIFEKDPFKREQIIGLFVSAGFIFVTGEIFTTMKDGTIIRCYDRLIFKSP